jgi:hypothetical protein
MGNLRYLFLSREVLSYKRNSFLTKSIHKNQILRAQKKLTRKQKNCQYWKSCNFFSRRDRVKV